MEQKALYNASPTATQEHPRQFQYARYAIFASILKISKVNRTKSPPIRAVLFLPNLLDPQCHVPLDVFRLRRMAARKFFAGTPQCNECLVLGW
jgi:hypothetical protein